MQLNEETCPVPESVLGQLYRASPQGLPALIETVPPIARATLAIYCRRRGHFASLALAIASTCNKDDLIDAGGDFGASLYEQARSRPQASYAARNISVSESALSKAIAQDLI